MNDNVDRKPDEYEKKLADIVLEDRERLEEERKRRRSSRITLGLTFVVLAGLAIWAGFAGRHVMMQYGDGFFAEKVIKVTEKDLEKESSSRDNEKAFVEEESDHTKEGDTESKESALENEGVAEKTVAEMKDKKKAEGKKKTSNPISYDKKKKTLSFTVNGKSYTFPVKSKDFQEQGWDMADQSEDMHNTSILIDTLYDEHGSSIYLYHKKPEKNSKKEASCSRYELVFASKESEMMGLNMQCQMDKVEQIMEDADSVDDSEFDQESQNGEVVYHYGDYGVTVTFANKYVSALQIMKMEKEVKEK